MSETTVIENAGEVFAANPPLNNLPAKRVNYHIGSGRGRELPLGSIATYRDYTWVYTKFVTALPTMDVVLKKLNAGVETYKELLYDAHITSCVQSRKSGVLSMKWSINRGGNKTAEVDFITKIFDSLNMYQIWNEMLDAPMFGCKLMEILWQIKNGYLVPVGIQGKPQEWFFFDTNGIARFRKKLDPEGVPLPANKFMIVAHNATYENPAGDAILSKCYWPWFFKRDTLKQWAIFSEKYGMPYLVGKVPIGASIDEVDALAASLEELRDDAVIVIEDDKDAKTLDATQSSSPAIFENMIHFMNSEMSKAILSQTLTTEQWGTGGSYAMSQTHFEVRDDIVQSDKRLVEYWMNKLIELIVQYNFGELAEMPKFEIYREADVDLNLATRDKTLADTKQIKYTKAYFKRAYGFADDEIEVIDPTIPQQLPPAPAPFADDNTQHRHDVAGKVNAIALEDFVTTTQEIMQPVLDMFKENLSIDEIHSKVQTIFPDLPLDDIEKILADAIIMNDIAGKIGA
jgi:phage gp29-like protein